MSDVHNNSQDLYHPPNARFQNGTRMYKVVLMGEGGVGKSSLMSQFVCHVFNESIGPTIEDVYQKRIVIDGLPCILEVLDTAGQEEFSVLREQYMRGGEGFIVVYSVIDNSSFTELSDFKSEIEKVRDMEVKDIPLVLAGNKTDLFDERKVSKADGKTLANKLECPFFETSAALRENIDEVFHSIVRVIRTKEREEYYRELRSSQKGGGFCSCFSSSSVD